MCLNEVASVRSIERVRESERVRMMAVKIDIDI